MIIVPGLEPDFDRFHGFDNVDVAREASDSWGRWAGTRPLVVKGSDKILNLEALSRLPKVLTSSTVDLQMFAFQSDECGLRVHVDW